MQYSNNAEKPGGGNHHVTCWQCTTAVQNSIHHVTHLQMPFSMSDETIRFIEGVAAQITNVHIIFRMS